MAGLVLGLAVPLLLAAFRPVPDSPALRRRPVVHRPRHAAPPPRQARAIPPRIPNYTEFAACARRHSALREVYPVGARVRFGDNLHTVTGYTDSPGLPPMLRLSGNTIAHPTHVTHP